MSNSSTIYSPSSQYVLNSPSSCTVNSIEACYQFLKAKDGFKDVNAGWIKSVLQFGSQYTSNIHSDFELIMTSFSRYNKNLSLINTIQRKLEGLAGLLMEITDTFIMKNSYTKCSSSRLGIVLTRPPETISILIQLDNAGGMDNS